MISRGEADDVSFDRLAGKLGVSDRHLRRLFEEHLGASPIEVASSKRLHLAKQLLTQSNMPVTEVGFASGYQSVRRFNEAFKQKFRVAPSSVRRSMDGVINGGSGSIRIELPVIAPFNWNQVFGFLKAHGAPGVESFAGERYRRSFSMGKAVGAIEVGYESRKDQLSATISISDPAYLRVVIERVRDLFDTRLNPHAHLGDLNAKDPIAACYRSELGIRIPGAWEPFETAVCIILGQLVSVEQARLKVKKLVERFGKKVSGPVFEGCTHLFPGAGVLVGADFKAIGITRVREYALRELSRQVLEKRIDLSRSTDIDKTKAQLLAIKGIGTWTVEMIAMRCLGDANAFPGTDLIVKRALEYHRSEKGDWSPWNAYIALALWKRYAATLSKKSKRAISTEQ